MAIQPDNPKFQFRTMEVADAFRKTIWDSGLRFGRPIVWHDNNQRFPKDVIGASCFFLRLKSGYVGVTAAHVVRQFQTAKATPPSLVCQLHLMPFDLEGA